MIIEIRNILLTLGGIALAVQLTGCIFVDEHHRHYAPPEHHYHDADSINIRVHD